MKICVSSRTLEMQIKKAISSKAELVHFSYKEECLYFVGGEENNIPVQAMAKKSSREDDYLANFHPDQWNKILELLMSIQEQPIVIEFTHYLHTVIHERPEIEISGISKRF